MVRENKRPSWRVTASAGPSGTAAQTHRLGGNSENSKLPTAGRPHIVVGSDTSLPREATCGFCAPGGHSGAATSCGTAPVVVPNAGRAFPREGAAQTRPLKATSGDNHAECTNHACRGARMRTGPSFGAVRDNFDVLEATPVQPRRVRESRLLWVCGCVLRLSRGVA
jgi:hypothetical protein